VSPTLLLAAVFALVGAQLTRLAVPRRFGYAVVLALAVVGIVAAELVARWGGLGGPALGPLHPLADLVGMAVLEMIGAVLHGPAKSRGAA